jgi:hypothetical protein
MPIRPFDTQPFRLPPLSFSTTARRAMSRMSLRVVDDSKKATDNLRCTFPRLSAAIIPAQARRHLRAA